MLNINRILCVIILSCASLPVFAESSLIPLDKAPIDIRDPASLQRGAQLYMNNCLGCHSLKYERYSGLAKGIGITDESGNVLDQIVKENLLFTGEKITDQINTSMLPEDSEKWFGKAPPDLTLVSRVRGNDWLYTYLRSFYRDSGKQWGVNNLVYPDVGMPHVLLSLQGIQEAKYVTIAKEVDGVVKNEQILDSLELVSSGTMSPKEFDQAMADLVNFLSYAGEPIQVKRRDIGVFVLVFLGIFLVFSYLLKREYWKDIH